MLLSVEVTARIRIFHLLSSIVYPKRGYRFPPLVETVVKLKYECVVWRVRPVVY